MNASAAWFKNKDQIRVGPMDEGKKNPSNTTWLFARRSGFIDDFSNFLLMSPSVRLKF